MKKLFILLGAAGLLFSSCEPNKELYEELEAARAAQTGKVADFALTLTPKEYASTGDATIKANNYFVSEAEAKQYIPTIISKISTYKLVGPTSSATVTYDLYQQPVELVAGLSSAYTVTAEDYDSQGGNIARFDNFSSESELTRFMAYKYPEAVNNTSVNLTYTYHLGGGQTETRTSTFLVVDNAWVLPYVFSADDYTEVGNGRYKNFDSKAQAEERIGKWLNFNMAYVSAGDDQAVMYKLHIGGGKTENRVAYYIYNGQVWNLWATTIQQIMKLSFDGSVWVPDNTIKYELTKAEMQSIGAAFPGTAYGDNLANYGNFNIRDGYWTEALIIEGIGGFLKKTFPNAAEGQKYLVTYETYNGSYVKTQIALILKNGVYVKQ